MAPAVNILCPVFLSALLMLVGLGGAAASDLHVYGKSIHSDKTFLSVNDGRRTLNQQPHHQTNSEIRRSLDLKSLNAHVTPTTSKISLSNFIKLHQLPAKPGRLHANMPMRFGREIIPDNDKDPDLTPIMPQRFGRSWEVIRMCAECPDGRAALNPVWPQRFGSSGPYWSLLRTLANAPLVNNGNHWPDIFDSQASSEEVETQEKTFKG
ncbi:pro-FMRFamide-related neuropeptide VF [Etheostoma cragini]|uniref:pro-FMRFamide-related neuropeptide VF n=1 Tax=Etheostoma cragini TaxID=417921 RepID=UPI00155EA9A6|nr:pro-FMRFamide-related neuropeptide VF [Etheostoma cragini]